MKIAGTADKWIVTVLLFFAAGLNYADRTAITAVFPLLRRDLGMSDVALGATGTVFLWAYAALSPFAGYAGDRVPRARLVTISLGVWSVVMALSAAAANSVHLLVMRALLGVAEAAYIPAAVALLAGHHDSQTRAKAIGIHLAGFSVGMVDGGWLAGYLGDHLGWRPSFLILGGAGIVLTGICMRFLSEGAPAAEAEGALAAPLPIGRVMAQLVSIPTFLVLTAEIIVSGTANSRRSPVQVRPESRESREQTASPRRM